MPGDTAARSARSPRKRRWWGSGYALRPTRPQCGVAAGIWRSWVVLPTLFFIFPGGLTNSPPAGMTHIENVNPPLFPFDREHNAMRFKHQLPEVLVEVFPLTRKPTTFREPFQGINLAVECLKPSRRIHWGPFVNVCEGFSNPGLGFGCDNNLVFHFSEMPCPLPRVSRNSRMGRPSPRFACSSPRLMPRMLSNSSRSSRSF